MKMKKGGGEEGREKRRKERGFLEESLGIKNFELEKMVVARRVGSMKSCAH